MGPDAWIQRLLEKKTELDSLKPFPVQFVQNLDEWFKVELTYSSNAIEGNTLSRQETALVIEKGLTVEGKSLREHLEAVNHAEAIQFIRNGLVKKKRTQIKEADILEVHRIILSKINDSDAGRYRRVPVRIAGSTVMLPNFLKVPDLMADFMKWLSHAKESVVQIAADAHFKFVSIHPFIDGNGRVGRLLMNLLLMQGDFPPALIRKEDRKEYLNALERGQTKNQLDDYYEIIYSAIDRSLDIYLDMLKGKESSKIKQEKFLKIGELAKETGETVSTLRFWTKEGLLLVHSTTVGGYQLYSAKMIDRVKKIKLLQDKERLTIAEIKNKLIENQK